MRPTRERLAEIRKDEDERGSMLGRTVASELLETIDHMELVSRVDLIALESFEEKVTKLKARIENAGEYIIQVLPHLGDIQGFKHQVDHAEHFVKQSLAWLDLSVEAEK